MQQSSASDICLAVCLPRHRQMDSRSCIQLEDFLTFSCWQVSAMLLIRQGILGMGKLLLKIEFVTCCKVPAEWNLTEYTPHLVDKVPAIGFIIFASKETA